MLRYVEGYKKEATLVSSLQCLRQRFSEYQFSNILSQSEVTYKSLGNI
jgi:hypothetical protein